MPLRPIYGRPKLIKKTPARRLAILGGTRSGKAWARSVRNMVLALRESWLGLLGVMVMFM